MDLGGLEINLRMRFAMSDILGGEGEVNSMQQVELLQQMRHVGAR